MKPKKISIDYWMRLYRRDRDDGKMSECRHLIPKSKGETNRSCCERCPFGDGHSLNVSDFSKDPCAVLRNKLLTKFGPNSFSFEELADHFYNLENQKRNIKLIEAL